MRVNDIWIPMRTIRHMLVRYPGLDMALCNQIAKCAMTGKYIGCMVRRNPDNVIVAMKPTIKML
jgi:hypothetical protein